MSGSALRYVMGRPNPCESEIYEAVRCAIEGGVSVREFLEVVREAWDCTMSEKAKADDRALTAAKTRASS